MRSPDDGMDKAGMRVGFEYSLYDKRWAGRAGFINLDLGFLEA